MTVTLQPSFCAVIYRRVLVLWAIALPFCALPVQAADIHVSHGGHLVTVETDNNETLSVHFIFQSGVESPPSVMHYVEHLTWWSMIGEQDKTASRHSNAWTTAQAVAYWQVGRTEDLSKIVRSLSKALLPLDVPPQFAEEEREIIEREYDLRLLADIDARALEAMNRFLYAGNRLAESSIGKPRDIAKLSYKQAKLLHEHTHRLGNLTLLVVGDIDRDHLLQTLSEVELLPWNAEGVGKELSHFAMMAPGTQSSSIVEKNIAPRMIWRRVVELNSAVNFDVLETMSALLSHILRSNVDGGLAGPLRFDEFIAANFDLTIFPIDERHIEFYFKARPDKGVSFVELELAFLDAMRASLKGLPKASYQRVYKRFQSSYWPDWDDEKALSHWLKGYATERVSKLREPLSTRELKRIDERLNLAGLNELLKSFDNPARTAITVIENTKD